MTKITPNAAIACVLAVTLAAGSPESASAQSVEEEREWMYQQYLHLPDYVRGGQVEPHWLGEGEAFWFVEHGAEERPVYLVEPQGRNRRHLFDLSEFQERLRSVVGDEIPDGEPSNLVFDDRDNGLLRLTVGDRTVEFNPGSGELRVLTEATPRPLTSTWNESASPNGASAARIHNHNVWLRSLQTGTDAAVTTDGTPDRPWGGPTDRGPQVLWGPAGVKLAVVRQDLRAVPKIPIVTHLTEQPEVQWEYSWLAEGPFEITDLYILDVETRARTRANLDAVDDDPERIYLLGWLPDGSEILIAQVSRDFQTLRVSAVESETGRVREVLQESRDTFFHIPAYRPLATIVLADGRQFVWRSAQTGWHHLYLYDIRGELLRQLTDGPFDVVEIIAIDEDDGWVYFTAHSDPAHPYDTHLCRVSIQGGKVHQLTEGRGVHSVVLSPLKKVFIDTHRHVDLHPVVELRSVAGRLIDTLSVAERHTPSGFAWSEPEEFVVKAADGETDLHGVLYKPYDFDPTTRYPVVEIMVGRPTVAVNEILRWHTRGGLALAQLGFVVVALDARGTPERGLAFHAVVYGAMGRYEIPDHIAALNQLFEERPYLDRTRVGVTGSSYGGYYTIRAMLQAPDIYRVAVAVAPYDPRGDAVTAYMGLPRQNPRGYEYASNRWMVDRLEGHLLIQHGSADTGAYLSWTMQLVDAMIKAGRSVDLQVFPDEGHDLGPESADYARDARRRYLQRHLRAGETGGY